METENDKQYVWNVFVRDARDIYEVNRARIDAIQRLKVFLRTKKGLTLANRAIDAINGANKKIFASIK